MLSKRGKKGVRIGSVCAVISAALCGFLCIFVSHSVEGDVTEKEIEISNSYDLPATEEETASEVIQRLENCNNRETGLEEFSGTNDLVYRTAEGESISLQKGEKINLLVGKSYENVSISMLGMSAEEYVGDLREGDCYTFTVEQSGDYIILAGKDEKINITDEIFVEVEYEATGETGYLPLD